MDPCAFVAPQEEGLEEGEGQKLSSLFHLGSVRLFNVMLRWLWLKMIHPQNGWEIWKVNFKMTNICGTQIPNKSVQILRFYRWHLGTLWGLGEVWVCLGSWRSFRGECEPKIETTTRMLWFGFLFGCLVVHVAIIMLLFAKPLALVIYDLFNKCSFRIL